MIVRTCCVLLTFCSRAGRGLTAGCCGSERLDDRGQTTAEYALVIVGAAAVAVAVLTWATGTGKIGWLLDKMVDTVADMVS